MRARAKARFPRRAELAFLLNPTEPVASGSDRRIHYPLMSGLIVALCRDVKSSGLAVAAPIPS